MNSLGLSTQEALHRLYNDVGVELKELEHREIVDDKKWLHPSTWEWDAFHHESPYSTFKWTSGFMLLLEAIFLFVCYGSSDDPRFSRLIIDALIILMILVGNVCLVGWDSKLKYRELRTKIQELLNVLEECMHKCELTTIQYPTLNMPLSPCITLQWTYRDGHIINLHWSLLVQGDVICLRPGQLSPAKCRPLDRSGEKEDLQIGEQYVPKATDSKKKSFKYPRARKPLQVKNFLVLETPYIQNLRLVIKNSRLRPLSIFDSERHLITSYWITKIVIPVVLIIMFCVNTLRYIYLSSSVGSWQEMLMLLQVQAVLPILPLLFPSMWLLLNTYGNAYLQTLFLISKEVKLNVEPFDEFGEILPIITKCNLTWQIVSRQFFDIIQGKEQYPTRSTNLLHVLGSVTALCCVDKKGILSWPNPTAEKVFFLHSPSYSPESSKLGSEFQSVESLRNIFGDKDEPQMDCSDLSTKTKAKTLEREQTFKTESVVEVLDLTHDSQIAFGLQFDDLKWKKYINSLKPLGLAILLNTCNPATQDNYTQFSAHIAYEALENEDVVPVVNRREVGLSAEYTHSHSRCLCELARQIGFSEQAMNVFQLQEQLSTFRPVQPNMVRKDKFAKSLSITKLKFPFPHMVSVIMKECSSGMSQLLSQGTGDIILDSCSEYWDGTDIHPLAESDRKRILDFYHRTSLTSYCTAFAYRPMTTLVSTEFNHLYLELPANSSRLYPSIRSPTPTISWDQQSLDTQMRCTLAHYFSTDSILGNDRQQEPIADVDGCFAAQCNQIFIGMVTMQYQARIDIVHLIEQLDKACIRFVHFSKENELRSRVFSEKMGLESGWNCHISLLCDCLPKTDKSNTNSNEDNVRLRRSSDFNMWKAGGDCCQPFPQVSVARYSVDRSLHRSCSAPSAINVDVSTVKFEDEISMYDVSASEAGSVSSLISARRTKLALEDGSNKYIETDEISDDIDMKEDPLAPLCQNFQADELNTSRSPSHITESTDQSAPVAFDMSNRAKLPKGIENIRPHLENIDNVPLLVSLFTDCTPHATQEMIKIMQENGEVVCCMGSAANCHNMAIFLQADASIAIEPLYPQLCMKQPVFTTPLTKEGSLIVHISHQLNSLMSSLSFYREEPVSIYSLIMQSRHVMSCIRNCFQFMLMCSLSLMLLQLLNCLVLLPPMLAPSHVLWMSCIVVPLISLSLTKSPVDPQITTHSTGKNKITIDKTAVFHFIAFTGIKFIPSIIICIICFGLMLHDFCISTTSDPEDCHLVQGNIKFTRLHEWNGWSSNNRSQFIFAQNFTALLLVFYFVCISASFVHKFYQLWTRVPFQNKTWCIIVIIVLFLQFLYGVIDVSIQKAPSEKIEDIIHIPLSTGIVAIIWPIVLISFNENIKRYEIRSNVRNQKRARLEFGTKLGMNSPF